MRALELVLAVTAVASFPVAAHASTAALDGDVLQVTGTPGVDQLSIFADGAQLIVRDGFVQATAGPGCTLTVLLWAACPLAAVARVEVDLGDGDDVAIVSAPRPTVVHGGAGDDALLAGGSPIGVTLDGGPGDDHLSGSPYADVLLGGPGDDGIDGGRGGDLIDPGPGRDSVADEGGDDTILAADGEPDYIDCGPGADRGTFDATDITSNCEGAPASTAPRPDCTPEIAPPTAADARALLRGRALRVDLDVAPGCSARATLLIAGVAYAHASASTADGVTLRPSHAGLRALRRHRAAAVVRVVARGAGGAVVTRRLRLAA